MKRPANNDKTDKITYLYGRLSDEDANKGDSLSIENQKKILMKYAEDNGFTNCEYVYDDGYSGGDWKRPAFCKMIEDVECVNGHSQGFIAVRARLSESGIFSGDIIPRT
jgi:DNA invertase Pin-like site-specific DNA recombinase